MKKSIAQINTDNECECLINFNYQISNFYMSFKLHKSMGLKEIISNQNSEYINITENLQIKGRPAVAGPVYYPSGISKMLYIILEPSLSFIPHILRNFFDFLERVDSTFAEDTLLSSCNIKSFYTNIHPNALD